MRPSQGAAARVWKMRRGKPRLGGTCACANMAASCGGSQAGRKQPRGEGAPGQGWNAKQGGGTTANREAGAGRQAVSRAGHQGWCILLGVPSAPACAAAGAPRAFQFKWGASCIRLTRRRQGACVRLARCRGSNTARPLDTRKKEATDRRSTRPRARPCAHPRCQAAHSLGPANKCASAPRPVAPRGGAFWGGRSPRGCHGDGAA